ncbi:MAG: CBS domain-containing protein [Bdellovibrionota bacterium]
MSLISPSSSVVVSENTSIAECIQRMCALNVGSVLIVREGGGLVGIFTERDVLKNVEMIHSKGCWDQPVKTVMSSPVISVKRSEIGKAGEKMLKYGFRHMPVMRQGKNGKPGVVGVISMRDLFREQVERHHRQAEKLIAIHKGQSKKKGNLGVFSLDDNLYYFLKDIVSKEAKLGVQRFSFGEEGEDLKQMRALILDVDGVDVGDWTALLRKINSDADLPFSLVIFNPILHEQPMVAILERLNDSKKLAVFAKPVNPLAVIKCLKPYIKP